jgi:hypothetical protein
VNSAFRGKRATTVQAVAGGRAVARAAAPNSSKAKKSCRQGLTLVHFSAQLECFVWDRGCA